MPNKENWGNGLNNTSPDVAFEPFFLELLDPSKQLLTPRHQCHLVGISIELLEGQFGGVLGVDLVQ